MKRQNLQRWRLISFYASTFYRETSNLTQISTNATRVEVSDVNRNDSRSFWTIFEDVYVIFGGGNIIFHRSQHQLGEHFYLH